MKRPRLRRSRPDWTDREVREYRTALRRHLLVQNQLQPAGGRVHLEGGNVRPQVVTAVPSALPQLVFGFVALDGTVVPSASVTGESWSST